MILRAQTVKNKMTYFGVKDAPVCINDRQSVLCNVPKSPILLTKTIARGTENKELFEFDFVVRKFDSKFVGYVIYIDGFYIWDPKTNAKMRIRDSSLYSFYENTVSYRIDDLVRLRTPIRFSNGKRRFDLSRIMYSDREKLYIELKGSTGPVDISSVRMGTGAGSGRKELVYGDYLSDGVIMMHNLQPMVKLANGEYRELEAEDYA